MDEVKVKVNRIGQPALNEIRPLRIIVSYQMKPERSYAWRKTWRKMIYVEVHQTPMQGAYLQKILKELDERKDQCWNSHPTMN